MHRSDEALRIENRFVLEHEVNGAGQLDGYDGVGLELIAIHLCFESLR